MGCAASNQLSIGKAAKDKNKPQDNYTVETNGKEHYGNENHIINEDNDTQVLTENEKRRIRDTWEKLIKNKERLGKTIFFNIFKMHPAVKSYFRFRDVKTDALFDNKDFCAHAFRFIQILDSHVINLDDLRNGVLPVLRNLGRFHARHGEWFSALNFNLFTESILFTWEEELGDGFTIEERDAWAALLDYLVQGMTEGYQMAKVSNESK